MSALVLSFGLTMAQKKEIAAAFKAIESNDIATAKAQISAADGILGGKTQLLEPSVLEQYYYAKGMSLLKSGNTTDGAEYLAKINDLGKSKIYSGKNADKQKVYYVGKPAADASGLSGLKEETYVTTTSGKLADVLNPILKKSNDDAMAAYNAKNYVVAGDKFLEVYNLLKAAGNDNLQLLYYSGINYNLAKKYENAIFVYNQLLKNGYTGVETTYSAKNKKTGQVEPLDKNAFDLYKKMGANSDYTEFKTETSKSVEQELYENLAGLYIDSEKYSEAIAFLESATKKFPNNTRFTELLGTAYFRSGKTDSFIQNLKDQVAKNPKDITSWYNLGVLSSKDPAKLADAENYFKKALELDPNYVNALQGMIFNIYVNGDDAAIKEIDAAKKAKKMDLFNKLLDQRRTKLSKAIPYAEKWFSLDSKNLEVVSLLKGLYQTSHNDAKYQEMKALETSLKATK